MHVYVHIYAIIFIKFHSFPLSRASLSHLSPASSPPHPKKERPLWLSVSLLLHISSVLVRAGIDLLPGPAQDPCSDLISY